jgi:hypothetical protein
MNVRRAVFGLVALTFPALGWGVSVSAAPQPKTTVVVYDDFEKPGG